jgi:outer membrane protein OmpA-like peptidoglycan-associated protein
MKGRLTALAAGTLLALAGPTWADSPASGTAADSGKGSTKTVKKEEIKTWTTTVDGKEWSVRPATPTYEGDTGLFRLSSAYTLQKGAFALSFFRDNYDRDPKGIDFSIHGVSFGYGVTDRFQIIANMGLQNRVKANYLFQPGFYNDLPFVNSGWQTGFGDIKAGGKYKFLDDYRGDPLGLALKAVVKFPTADEKKGLGTGKTSFSFDLVASKQINYVADLHASIGYEINGNPSTLDIANAFKWGVGLDIPTCKRFALQAEVIGRSYGDTTPKQTNPVDLVVGPVVWIGKGWFIRPAWNYAFNYDARGTGGSFTKRSGRQISIGYHPGTPCCEVYVPPPPPPAPVNRPPTVSLDCAKKVVLQGETTPCHATAADPDGDPLTYTWSTSAGRLTGSGADTVLDTAGVPCDTTITVTVQVSDGRGGTASASDNVKVRCPEKPKPEAVTCTSGGFPRNLARLNNVDKACLDDVASKLRSDPRSRVVVVGHADSGERYPDVTGRKRAEAVRDYLVKERGVDAARITTKSAGATRPLDTGKTAAARARNRRVEVIFVPEGATSPEDDD